MSKILSEATEKVIKMRRITGIKCDICGKIVPVDEEEKSRYFEVTTENNDFSNRYDGGIENLDICPDCIKNFTTKYLQNVNSVEYIEIHTSYASAYERWESERRR